jgi:hypothetical protein
MQGNPPFGKFKLQVGGISVTNLRMSSPTIGVEINPEFKGYLRALKTRKEKHLYINLQQAHGGSNAGENERSEAFRRLSLELEFKDTLTLVTLDKNTSFYGQKDTFGQEKMSFKTFKDTFISRISSSDSGFYLPETIGEITKEQVLNIFGTMLDDIHKNYFDGREKLTVEERQNMIEIAYNLMITKFIQLSGAKYYNNSCKDCIDRGGGANALMNNTVAFLKQDTKDLDLLQTMTFSDALWARKREIIYERLERSLKAMEVIVNKPESREWMLEQMGNPQIKHFKAKDNQTIRS